MAQRKGASPAKAPAAPTKKQSQPGKPVIRRAHNAETSGSTPGAATIKPVSAGELRKLLDYDQTTGIFLWRVNRGAGAVAGQRAGSANNGYVRICIDGVNHAAHRLAWLYVYGRWPQRLLDHRDTDKSNNRITNLRDATKTINGENRRHAQRNNSLGLLGVTPHGQKFRAQIWVGPKKRNLGHFKTPTEAHEAYVTAKRELHQGCTL